MRNEAKEKPGAEPGPKPAADGGTDQEAGRGAGRSGAGAGAAGPDGERAAGPDDGRTAGTDDDRADRTDAEAEYRELVQLAYFVLPGKGKRIYRLALARRIVERAAGRGPGRGLGRERGRARRRTRVLRQAMRPSRRRQIGLAPWLRSMPARLPDPALTAMLSTLEPRVRLAYVLLYVAGMPRYAVRDQLSELRVTGPWAVIRAAEERHREAASAPSGRGAGRTAGLEHGGPPSTVPRRRGTDPFAPPRALSARGRTPIPIGVAVALTAVLIGALVASETGAAGRLLGGTSSAEAHGLRMVSAAADAWRRAPHSLDVWPARGGLTRDKAFLDRALHAWAAAGKAGRTGPDGGGDPQLLFAGRVDGRPVALMRRGDRVGRYTGADDRLVVSSAGTDPSRPMAVGGGRYLLAPWDRAETLAGVRVVTQEGVTAPLPSRTRCGRGPVLNLESDDGARTVGEFGGPRPVVLVHRSPKAAIAASAKKGAAKKPAKAATPPKPPKPAKPAKAAKAGKPVRLSAEALEVWERVACLTPVEHGRSVTEATAWEFWSGTLPRGGGRAQWVCTSMAARGSGGGAAGQSALLTRQAVHATGPCDPQRPVAGTWRRSAQGEWHYLAAAARGLTPQAKGPFRSGTVDSRLLHATPPAPEQRPARPVTLTARPSS